MIEETPMPRNFLRLDATPVALCWLVCVDADSGDQVAAGWPLANVLRMLELRHPEKTVSIWADDGRLVAVRRRDGLVA